MTYQRLDQYFSKKFKILQGSENPESVDGLTNFVRILIVEMIRYQAPKCPILKGAYWISPNSSFIQYCDSNIGLFSIAPPLVIALPTL